MIFDDNEMLWEAAVFVAALAALHLFLVQNSEFNIMAELNVGSQIRSFAYLAGGAAGGAVVVDVVDKYILED